MRFIRLMFSMLALLPMPATACGNAAFNRLALLVGEWQVFRDDASAGEFALRRGAGDCALVEQWKTVDGKSAIGLHWVEPDPQNADEAATILRQVYVDSTGWFIHADGAIAGNALVYTGNAMEDDEPVLLRVTLHGLGTNRIVHIGDVSRDGGETWNHVSTLIYIARDRAAD